MMRPMTEAPRDRTFILALYRPPEDHREARFSGRWFSVFHEGVTPGGFDMGWALYPGYGGVSDDHFAGWLPYPDPDASPTTPERSRVLEEADIDRVFDENINDQAARLRVFPRNDGRDTPGSWMLRVRKAALLEALSASPTELVQEWSH